MRRLFDLRFFSSSRNQPPSGRDSPDMDFLEMDFDPGDSDDDLASERQQQVQQPAQQPPNSEPHQPVVHAEVEPEHLLDFAGGGSDGDNEVSVQPEVTVTLSALSADEVAAMSMLSPAENAPMERPKCISFSLADDLDEFFRQVVEKEAVSSAPLQSPAEHNSAAESCMVRSLSLNSPIARQQFLARLDPCMVRGESDPGSSLVGGARNKRRHSGEGGVLCQSSSSSSGTTVVCGIVVEQPPRNL